MISEPVPRGGRREDLALALRLADLADEVSMRAYSAGTRDHTLKEDGSPVTRADTEIESEIRSRLAQERPGDGVFGEEFGGAREGDRVWLIDPIDGTASFVEGGTEWATLIALVEDGRPVVGVVSRPVAGTRWWGATGLGAFRNGSAIHVSDTSRLGDAVIQEDFRLSASRGLEWSPVWSLARECAAVRPWDAFYFMAVAEGEVDFAANWWAGWGPDLAGQACIVEAAGGRFSDLRGDLDIDARVQVVSNGVLHDTVLQRFRDLLVAGNLDEGAEPVEDIAAIRAARAEEPAAAWRAAPEATRRDRGARDCR